MSDKVKWLTYDFGVYLQNTEWNPVGGIYIFCGPNPQGLWKAYYIGQTNDFKARLPTHERWGEARRLGATHVHAMVVPLEANRLRIEAELIGRYQPPLNTQQKW